MQDRSWTIITPPASAKLAGDKTLVADASDDPGEQLVPLAGYARRVMPEAFENLNDVLAPLLASKPAGHVFDVTVFYSERKDLTTSENDELLAHNQRAFDGAKQMGGLLIYYQGPLLNPAKAELPLDPRLDFDFLPDCMSFCIWESLAKAKQGASNSDHRAAAEGAARWYRGFAIEKLKAILATSSNGQPTVRFAHPKELLETDFA